MHPVEDIKSVKSNFLKNKTIVLAVTGSIAAIETIKISRELIRHGAKVIPVMTKAATKIIHPDALWFATGKKPIIELSGATEHVSYLGRVKKPADMLLICPATANTISKIAYGIDDTAVTTFATTAIGSKTPVMIVPAMHLSMYDHEILQENISKLKKIGIKFIEPNILGNKAKLPSNEKIVANVLRLLSKKSYNQKKVLIIGGPTVEEIDEIRVFTNKSSGKTAVNLARNAFFYGADLTLFYGNGSEIVPDYIKKTDFTSIKDLKKLIEKSDLDKYDYIFVCAAISDYIPEKSEGKIPSGKKSLSIELTPAEKIISIVRKKAKKAKIIGFKAETKEEKIVDKSKKLLEKNNLDFVIGNKISAFSSNENKIFIIDKKGKTVSKKDNKDELARFILNKVK